MALLMSADQQEATSSNPVAQSISVLGFRLKSPLLLVVKHDNIKMVSQLNHSIRPIEQKEHINEQNFLYKNHLFR